ELLDPMQERIRAIGDRFQNVGGVLRTESGVLAQSQAWIEILPLNDQADDLATGLARAIEVAGAVPVEPLGELDFPIRKRLAQACLEKRAEVQRRDSAREVHGEGLRRSVLNSVDRVESFG